MEKLDCDLSWESDFRELDDVLDEGYFSPGNYDEDVEDDEFHEKNESNHIIIDK